MINAQPLLSIVITVYNTERFLCKCIDSILLQTYRNLEIIIVNDASTGTCEQIVREYQKKDVRVKYIEHTLNKGLFQARITGVEASNGLYIAFVDSDDAITVDYCRLLVKKATATSADIIVADFLISNEDDVLQYYNLDPLRLSNFDFKDTQVMDAFMHQRGTYFGWHTVWNKLYSRSLWNRCISVLQQFSNEAGHLVMTEDIAFSCVLWANANRAVNVHNAYYLYLRHAGQSINNSGYNKFERNIRNVNTVFRFFERVAKNHHEDFIAWRELYKRTWLNEAEHCNDAKKARALFESLFDEVVPSNDDGFFYSITTDCTDQIAKYEGVKKAIGNTKVQYVSFDLFDTLVLRPFLHPTDLFVMLNQEFNSLAGTSSYVDFARMRIEGEARCRVQSKLEEITLDEIYDTISAQYNISRDVAQKMKVIEIESEIKLSYIRQTGLELYELALAAEKKVIVTSDIYLPMEVIKALLKDFTPAFKLYISSQERATKHAGSLYKRILSDLMILPDEIVHIGDNAYSDIEQSKQAGIGGYLLPRTAELFMKSPCYTNVLKSNEIYSAGNMQEFLGLRCMFGVVANHLFDNPFINSFNTDTDFNSDPRIVGYYALGMHLYAVASWLLCHGDGKIHFVARDGYLPQQAYDIISNTSNSDYIYLSRKSLLIADIAEPIDVHSLFQKTNALNQTPVKLFNIFSCCLNVSMDEFLQLCRKSGFAEEKSFLTSDRYDSFLRIFIPLIDFDQLKERNKCLAAYFKRILKPDDVIFDIGYSGRIELAMKSLLGYKINAYYIHTNSDLAQSRADYGSFCINTFYDFKPNITGVLREHLFMQPSASCIGYDNNMNPIFDDYQTNYQSQFVTKLIQEAALAFVFDLNRFFKPCHLHFRKFDVSLPYECFLNNAGVADKKMFNCLVFEDDLNEKQLIKVVDFWETSQNANFAINSGLQCYEDVFIDGVYIKIIRRMNKIFPKGSRRREMLKVIGKKFFKKM